MQIAHLRTLVAIRDSGSFSAAAARVHLSHSAISMQMKQLEEALGSDLFDKGRRPATLTPLGLDLAERAQVVLDQVSAMETLGKKDLTEGEISIGFVPTTLQTILPVVLAGLRDRFANLAVRVRSDLSQNLAEAVQARDLDFAVLTAPTAPGRDLRIEELGREPLALIVPRGQARPRTYRALVADLPYIAFAPQSWLGGQIAQGLRDIGLNPRPAIELDSIDAIEGLVADGLGQSVVPQRLLAPPLAGRMDVLPCPGSQKARLLALAAHTRSPRQTVHDAIRGIITDAVENPATTPRTA